MRNLKNIYALIERDLKYLLLSSDFETKLTNLINLSERREKELMHTMVRLL